LNLLPYPRSLRRQAGFYVLPTQATLHLDVSLPRAELMLPLAERLIAVAAGAGVDLDLVTGPPDHPRLAIRAFQSTAAPDHPEGYALEIAAKGITIHYRAEPGLRAAFATLRQLLTEYGRRLPRLIVRDYPDFRHRGVMLDISRGRVPRLETLLELVEHLALFKINQFQLYTEHTFAYRNFEPVWKDWGAITGDEILQLDARCRELGIELVPNQNSFGHLRYWLEYPPLRKLAEVPEPYEDGGGAFLRYPTTLAPGNKATLPFLRGLFDELLPHFSSKRCNVGCDETWDLGRGQSRRLCESKGKGRVYVDFLKTIYEEMAARNRQMMFWGDIIIHYPELIRELPRDVVALNWGYEADHPFKKETKLFAESQLPFYVCPGTATWMSLIGRHDAAFTNLRRAAEAGLKNGAVGYLNTDWGDGGHPQPLAVSYLPYAVGAAMGWCAKSFKAASLVPVLSRDVFNDPTQRTAAAAYDLGFAHQKLNHYAMNVTPLGTVVAAPPPRLRELVCRDGLKYYARIPSRYIRAALDEVEHHRAVLYKGTPQSHAGEMLALELDMAARMAVESCHIMLWQQAIAFGKPSSARQMARRGIKRLQELDRDFRAYWPLLNKGTTANCSAFLQWRIDDFRRGQLHFAPEVARLQKPNERIGVEAFEP
jgi:hexosaminidase